MKILKTALSIFPLICLVLLSQGAYANYDSLENQFNQVKPSAFLDLNYDFQNQSLRHHWTDDLVVAIGAAAGREHF